MAFLRCLLRSVYLIVVGQPEPETTPEEEVMREKDTREGGRGLFFFQMPVHYPRYSKAEYEEMEEWKVDRLLSQYGLHSFHGGRLTDKRAVAIGTFLWPGQN